MQLNSSDAASVELRVAGYEVADCADCNPPPLDWGLRGLKGPGNTLAADGGRWDLNWLQVGGNVTLTHGRSWAFEDSCLTTWEARELGEWLLAVAAGTEQPFRGIRKPQGWLVFTEPNLCLALEDRTAGRVRMRMRIDFTGEEEPRLTHGGPANCLVYLDVSAGEVAEAAESWMQNLAAFPER
jgi:hypothetical protein